MSYPVSIIFSANLETIDSALLATEDFTEHLIRDVREALIRDARGKSYRIVSIDSVQRKFEDVYAEFDVSNDRGIAHNPMTHFRVNMTVQLREDCNDSTLDRCAAILQNLSQDEKLNCILPTYDFSDTTTQNATTAQQQTDLTNWLCGGGGGNYSFNFDGINENIITNKKPNLLIQGNDFLSVSAWIKISSYDALYSPIVSWFYQPTLRGWGFSILSTGQIFFWMQDGATSSGRYGYVLSTNTIPLNTWTHVAATKTNLFGWANSKAYINGVDDTGTTFGAQSNDVTAQMSLTNPFIGSTGSTGARYFDGNIYAPRVWTVELTAAQVLAESNNKTYETANTTGLEWDADFNQAVFGTFDFAIPNNQSTTGNSQTQNIEESDLSTDVPV
jgi:hypothetical protein